jgi:hypothetical protein
VFNSKLINNSILIKQKEALLKENGYQKDESNSDNYIKFSRQNDSSVIISKAEIAYDTLEWIQKKMEYQRLFLEV